MNDLSFKNYLYDGVGYLLENLIFIDLLRHGYDVYVGNIKEKEVDFSPSRMIEPSMYKPPICLLMSRQ